MILGSTEETPALSNRYSWSNPTQDDFRSIGDLPKRSILTLTKFQTYRGAVGGGAALNYIFYGVLPSPTTLRPQLFFRQKKDYFFLHIVDIWTYHHRYSTIVARPNLLHLVNWASKTGNGQPTTPNYHQRPRQAMGRTIYRYGKP